MAISGPHEDTRRSRGPGGGLVEIIGIDHPAVAEPGGRQINAHISEIEYVGVRNSVIGVQSTGGATRINGVRRNPRRVIMEGEGG